MKKTSLHACIFGEVACRKMVLCHGMCVSLYVWHTLWHAVGQGVLWRCLNLAPYPRTHRALRVLKRKHWSDAEPSSECVGVVQLPNSLSRSVQLRFCRSFCIIRIVQCICTCKCHNIGQKTFFLHYLCVCVCRKIFLFWWKTTNAHTSLTSHELIEVTKYVGPWYIFDTVGKKKNFKRDSVEKMLFSKSNLSKFVEEIPGSQVKSEKIETTTLFAFSRPF